MTDTSHMTAELAVCRAAIEAGLARGLVVSVYDGGAWPMKRSADLNEIVAALRSTEADEIVFRDATTGERRGWMHFVYGSAPDEVIADCTDNAITGEIYAAAESAAKSHDLAA
jgi:hypothetical protein